MPDRFSPEITGRIAGENGPGTPGGNPLPLSRSTSVSEVQLNRLSNTASGAFLFAGLINQNAANETPDRGAPQRALRARYRRAY